MKKQLNIDAIQSELKGESAFFPNYKGNSPTPPLKTEPEESHQEPAPVPPVRVVRDVPPVPPIKRAMKQRHPFDIYHDQYEALQDLALEDRKRGGYGSMSAMVREALDKLI